MGSLRRLTVSFAGSGAVTFFSETFFWTFGVDFRVVLALAPSDVAGFAGTRSRVSDEDEGL